MLELRRADGAQPVVKIVEAAGGYFAAMRDIHRLCHLPVDDPTHSLIASHRWHCDRATAQKMDLEAIRSNGKILSTCHEDHDGYPVRSFNGVPIEIEGDAPH
jgi:hypothetical protein